MKKLNFSLMTLIAGSILIASTICVFVFLNPWQLKEVIYSQDNPGGWAVSPDGSRIIKIMVRHRIEICKWTPELTLPHALENAPPIATINYPINTIVEPGFLDNDTIVAIVSGGKRAENQQGVPFTIFKRRFPEGWTGQLHRPELWIAILSLIVFLGSVYRDRRP